MRENRTYGSEGGESSNGYSPTPISWASFGEGKQLIEWISSSIDLADPDQDGYQIPFDLGIGYVEEGIALIGQEDMRQLPILLIQCVGDDLIFSQLCRATLAVIAHSLVLILYLVLQL